MWNKITIKFFFFKFEIKGNWVSSTLISVLEKAVLKVLFVCLKTIGRIRIKMKTIKIYKKIRIKVFLFLL